MLGSEINRVWRLMGCRVRDRRGFIVCDLINRCVICCNGEGGMKGGFDFREIFTGFIY